MLRLRRGRPWFLLAVSDVAFAWNGPEQVDVDNEPAGEKHPRHEVLEWPAAARRAEAECAAHNWKTSFVLEEELLDAVYKEVGGIFAAVLDVKMILPSSL